MAQIRLGHQEIQKLAPAVAILIFVYMLIALLFHPFIAFLAFLLFAISVFFSIDKNISYLDQKIKRLEYKLRTLELKVSEDFQTRKI